MGADNLIPADIRALAEELYERQTGVLTLAYSELAALLVPARNVRTVPAQRFTSGTIVLSASQLPTYKLIGRRADVARVHLAYQGAAADLGDVVRVGPSLDVIQAGTGNNAFWLNGAVRTLDLDVNECDIWLGIGDATPVTGPIAVSWRLEEYDPTAVVN